MTVRFCVAGALAVLLHGVLSAQPICPPHIRWQASFGSDGQEEATRIVQLTDGGFVIGGSSYEWSADPGNKTAPGYGGYDFYIVRLDSHGQKLWDRSFGSPASEYLSTVEQTLDGGFLLAGTSYANSSGDFYVVRVDEQGTKLWERFFGGSTFDLLKAAKQTADGGFILGGTSRSQFFASSDFWVVRLDTNGNKLWDAFFGGDRDDSLSDLQIAADGGFFLAGQSLSPVSGSRTAPFYGNSDYWLLRLDASGNKLWDRAYGGSEADQEPSLLIAPNGDLLLAGYSRSGIDGNKTVDTFGFDDFWVLRLDAAGEILWQRSYGGDYVEFLRDASPVGTNGFVLCGTSSSPPSGSKISRLFRYEDGWAIRIDADGNQLWDASFGTTGFDRADSVIPTADGGYAVLGTAELTNGNKTSSSFGVRDLWVIRLNPENPTDCDDDGVPNAQDLCNGTPFGAVVNSNGCAIEQICPCYDWPDHAAYVECVERASAEFQSAGLITSELRAELLAAAQAANCPPSLVQFGLVHVLIKDTEVTGGPDQGYLNFQPGTNTFWGSVVLLGEADSGIFINPGAGGWGSYDDNWYLDGKAYGRFQDGSNGLIVKIHATKPALETYPVEVDFSALGPTNITIQQLENGVLTYTEDYAGAIGSFSINSSYQQHPRVNPFWRMPDGSVGAMFDFYPEGEDRQYSIFVRANGLTRNVDYVSRVEAIGSGTYDSFSFMDERLGMFGNRHRILSNGRLRAASGQLAVDGGATIEFHRTSHFEADFIPIDLGSNEAGLLLSFSHGGFVYIVPETNSLTVRADFSGQFGTGEGTNTLPTGAAIEVKAFRNGLVSGSCLAENNSVVGWFITLSNQSLPRIIGSMGTAASNYAPAIAFSMDRLATFVCTNGNEILGTHFQITAVEPQFPPEDISDMHILFGELAFTITAERSGNAQPRLSITANDDFITLTWPDNTRLFRLESSSTLPGGFTTVSPEPEYLNHRNEVTVPRDAGSRFFRLRSGPD